MSIEYEKCRNKEELTQAIKQAATDEENTVDILAPYRKSNIKTTSDDEHYEEREKEHLHENLIQCGLDLTVEPHGGNQLAPIYINRNTERFTVDASELDILKLGAKRSDIDLILQNLDVTKQYYQDRINPKAEAYWISNHLIKIETSTRVRVESIPSWEAYVKRIKVKLAVIEYTEVHFKELRDICTVEFDKRAKSKRPLQIEKEISKINKETDKLRTKVAKATADVKKQLVHGYPTLSTCKVYVNATSKFTELYNQYLTLQQELAYYTTNIPIFTPLNGDDTSMDHEIKAYWRKYA